MEVANYIIKMKYKYQNFRSYEPFLILFNHIAFTEDNPMDGLSIFDIFLLLEFL